MLAALLVLCSCARPAVEVTPGPRAATPTNAHVWVSWARSVSVDPATVRLVEAGGAAVDAEARTHTSADVTVIELVPKQPLAARTKHAVRLAAPGGKDAVVGELTTGADADTKAPTWKGIARAAFVKAKAVCCNCSTSDPYAVLWLSQPSDDLTAAADLRWAVWVAADGAKVDTTQPPLLWARAWGDRLVLGHASMCAPANLTFPAQAKQLTVAIAPADAAGNLGPAQSVVLDLTKPLKKAP